MVRICDYHLFLGRATVFCSEPCKSLLLTHVLGVFSKRKRFYYMSLRYYRLDLYPYPSWMLSDKSVLGKQQFGCDPKYLIL
jgi:hypothetical protein